MTSQLVLITRWNLEEVGSDASEGMDLWSRERPRASRQKERASLLWEFILLVVFGVPALGHGLGTYVIPFKREEGASLVLSLEWWAALVVPPGQRTALALSLYLFLFMSVPQEMCDIPLSRTLMDSLSLRFFLPYPPYRPPADGAVQIEGDLPTSKNLPQRCIFSPQKKSGLKSSHLKWFN